MDALLAAGIGVWIMLPALIPNSMAVLTGGGTPVDFGKSWRGNRILGDGKTWRGFIGGAAFGAMVGMIQLLIAQVYPAEVWMPNAPTNYGFGPMPEAIGVVFLLAIGSLLGDMGGAFVKRRMGLARGQKVALLDMYDFVLGALLLTLIFFPDWFLHAFVYDLGWVSLLTVLIVVPLLHRLFNIIGYRTGLKKEPW
ncbi:MAG TPA: CDP-2,3-bis-(O-geranylgeranyl)-sn-glycerol synthase [Methanomassiliicoccales archaeon]|nr:CDP-2,3-bis-(O-geranylgeranyl)-sn-glycerol synthase [Methanomassiliicoccales archaeon]